MRAEQEGQRPFFPAATTGALIRSSQLGQLNLMISATAIAVLDATNLQWRQARPFQPYENSHFGHLVAIGISAAEIGINLLGVARQD